MTSTRRVCTLYLALMLAASPLPGDVADPAARLLHPGHQRQHPQRGPQVPVPELGAGLRVGRDPGRVIIGRPSHQARTQDP